MVRMRDGVRLATDVYLPNHPTRHAAIFWRTPYDKCGRYIALPQRARHYNERGYVLVAQDCRGKFRSEGETLPYTLDVEDSYDTLDWITSQPWSNGRVGLLGGSYSGYTVWAGVASGHPAVRAAIPQVTGIDLADLHWGSRWKQVVPNLWGADDLVQMYTDHEIYYLNIDYNLRPVTEAFREASEALGKPCHAMDVLLRNSRTGDLANPYGNRHPYYTTDVPVLHWLQWFDVALGGPMGLTDYHYFRSLPGRRDLHFMRADSGDHGGFLLENVPKTPANDPNTNDAVLDAMVAASVREEGEFFDPFLRGKGELPAAERRARWHVGHVGWQESPDWPPTQSRPVRYYLGGNGRASGSPPGVLTTRADTNRSAVNWTHDPANPVPSTATQDGVWTLLENYPDECDLADRPDVLTFTTDVLNQPLDVAGPINAFIAVGSSAPSMHLFLKLLDVDPSGAAHPISRGQIVVHSPDADRLVQVDLMEIAYRVRQGHRLRIQITSSDYPWFLVHPGTDDNPWFARKMVTNKQLVVVGGASPSHLDITVLPPSL